jgi:hypothetical protein
VIVSTLLEKKRDGLAFCRLLARARFPPLQEALIASTGQSVAASLTAFSCSGGTFGLITSATSLPILKTSGTLSTQRPQAVHKSLSIDTFISGSWNAGMDMPVATTQESLSRAVARTAGV